MTVTGKGDSGVHAELPKRLRWPVYAVVIPWTVVMLVIYCMIMFGGFVETWGRDHSFTFRHYIEAFGVTTGPHGLVWAGAAWNSFWNTLTIAAIASPLTAGIGLLTAYLLVRQRFTGRVENGDYGLAIAYSSALIVVMLVVISLVQVFIGERQLGRRQNRHVEHRPQMQGTRA